MSDRRDAAITPPAPIHAPASPAPSVLSSEFRGIIRLILLMLAFAGAWTFFSRVPVTQTRPASPPIPKEGFTAPDFSLDSLDGRRTTLSDLRGRPVVVNVWASWCLPCRTEMTAFERVYQSFKDRGLIIIGVNMTSQDSEAAARAFVNEHDLTFTIVLDPLGIVRDEYTILGLPSTYFVSRDGVIRSVVIGGPMPEATIALHVEEILAEP